MLHIHLLSWPPATSLTPPLGYPFLPWILFHEGVLLPLPHFLATPANTAQFIQRQHTAQQVCHSLERKDPRFDLYKAEFLKPFVLHGLSES